MATKIQQALIVKTATQTIELDIEEIKHGWELEIARL